MSNAYNIAGSLTSTIAGRNELMYISYTILECMRGKYHNTVKILKSRDSNTDKEFDFNIEALIRKYERKRKISLLLA